MNKLLSLLVISAVIGYGISYSKIYLFHIIALIIIFKFFLLSLKSKKIKIPNVNTYLFSFLFLMFFWYFTTLIWSIEKFYTIQYLFYLVNGIFLVTCIVQFSRNINHIERILDIAKKVIIIEIMISLLEIFTTFRYPLSPYSSWVKYFGRSGIDWDVLTYTAVKYIETTPTGFMANPNNLATTLNLFLPYFLFLKNKKVSLFLSSAILIIIFYCGSRGNIIAYFLILFFFLSFYNLRRFSVTITLSPLIFSILFFIYKFLQGIDNAKVQEFLNIPNALFRYLFSNDNSMDSIGIRHNLIQNGLEALKQSHYLGVGGGGSKKVLELMGSTITSMHNFWIEILVDTGLFFFILFAIWYLSMIVKLYVIQKHTDKNSNIYYLASATSLSLLGFIIGSISASSTIYLLPMWLIIAVAISIINIYNKEVKRKELT